MSIDNFTGKAEAYAIGRPGYPQSAVDYICSLVPSDGVFADIGAGTGKFTIELAKRNYSIYAVEPNADMNHQLVTTLNGYSNVQITNGTAENTHLPDHSVDAITVAHALHWFDLDLFRQECLRILKPGGLIIVLYNLSPHGEMIHISKKATDYFCTNPTIKEFPNHLKYDRATWLAYIASQDDLPVPGDPTYDAHIENVNKRFDQGNVNGFLDINRITTVYSERI